MQKRIWILSELYYPEESATGYYLTRVAEGLAGAYDVHVLSAQPTYLARGTKAPTTEMHNGVNIRRCAGTTLNKDVLVFRLMNLVTISLSILCRALFAVRKDDAVLAVTNPPTLPFVGALVCWLRGARFVLRIEDLYPDALVAAGVASPGSLTTRVYDRLQRRLCGFASGIVVLGRDTKEILTGRYPQVAQKVTLIPNWADVVDVVPRPRSENALLTRLGLSAKFVVQYSGNMGRTHDIESLVACAESLRDDPRVHFLMIGWGAKEDWLRTTCAHRRLDNITVLPPLPRREIPVSLNGADLAVIPMVPGMLGISVPSRLYNIMAAGKPVVVAADDASEIARVVREEGIGWVVPPRSPALLVEAIREAACSPGRLEEMGARARKAAETKYVDDGRYRVLFQHLLSPDARPGADAVTAARG
jgi:colanic acid biosynthesis glycosyl transferase WcaI